MVGETCASMPQTIEIDNAPRNQKVFITITSANKGVGIPSIVPENGYRVKFTWWLARASQRILSHSQPMLASDLQACTERHLDDESGDSDISKLKMDSHSLLRQGFALCQAQFPRESCASLLFQITMP